MTTLQAPATSASARRRHGTSDTGLRATLSLARRVHDPLFELMRVDVRGLGLGQNLTEVHQGLLRRHLDAAITACLARIGIDVNRADPALLAPSNAVFLRENLKLRLMNARLALLSRDGNTFREDMRISAEWMGRYFDLSNAGVEAAKADLVELQKTPVGVDLPNLQASLTALRGLQAVPDRRIEGAAPAAAKPAAPAKKN